MKKTLTGFVLLQLLFGVNTQAGEISQASIEYSTGIYTINFDAVVNAPQKKVYSLLTDYGHLSRINDNITESTLLVASDASTEKFRLLIHACILFFCRETIMVENVSDNSKDEITATIDPNESDFKSGMSTWKILPVDEEHTSIMLYQKLEPDFWYPPVIGPWLIKKKIIKELSIMLNRLEQLAIDQHSY